MLPLPESIAEPKPVETKMISNESKNEMEVMVLTDLAAICKKLAEHAAVPEGLRVKVRHFVEEYDSLLPVRGKGTAAQHAAGEQLLVSIARFLPRVLEVQSQPATAPRE